MVCFLLNKDDFNGLRLSRLLQQTENNKIKLISADELIYAPYFCCGFQNGKAFFDIRLSDGFVFSNDTVSTVLNRIHYLPLQHIQQFKQEDRMYVEAELTATFTFLFAILPHQIFNETSGLGFCGKRRSRLEWMLLAQQAGFENSSILYQHKTLQTYATPEAGELQSLLYFNNKCYSSEPTINAPNAIGKSLLLGHLSGEKILEIYYKSEGNRTFFIEAKTMPEFQNTGHDFIKDLNCQL